MSTIISARVEDQALLLLSVPKIASGGANECRVEVLFDDTWKSYGKTAIFYKNKNKVYHVVMTDDTCIIPHEVLAEAGRVYFGILGVSGSTTRTTEVVALAVSQGAITGVQALEPLPDVYAQVLSAYGMLSARVNNLTTLSEGSTTGDAELIDARVSDVGHAHDNVGGLLRTNMSLLRMHNASESMKEIDLYSQFAHVYINGKENGQKDTISNRSPVKLPRYVTVKTMPGYQLSAQKYSDATGSTAIGYTEWTGDEVLLGDDYYYRICIRRTDGAKITLDEGYALTMKDPFYYGEKYGNILDTLLPMMRHGEFSLQEEGAYYENGKTGMFTKGGFTLSEPAVIHCTGEAAIAFQTYTNNIVSATTYASDTGWCKELTIPADTFGVLYFRAAPTRPVVEMNDLKLLQYGHSINVAADGGNINRASINPMRKSAAHRGYSWYGRYAPENTLPAFRLAKKHGFDAVECDVRITSDGVPVICHDLMVDRVSNGTGYVHQKTLEELRGLDFSVACVHPEYKGTKMPTLEETLICCKNLGIDLLLEIEPECIHHEETIVNLVKTYGMENAVSYVSFSLDVLRAITRLDPSAPVGLNADNPNETVIAKIKSLRTGYNDAFLHGGNMTNEIVETCKRNRIPVELWVLDVVESMYKLNPYIRGVTSEYTNFREVMLGKEMEGV